MTDPYFEWLDEQARREHPAERADREHARLDRLADFTPLVSDARAVRAAGRLSPERKDRS